MTYQSRRPDYSKGPEEKTDFQEIQRRRIKNLLVFIGESDTKPIDTQISYCLQHINEFFKVETLKEFFIEEFIKTIALIPNK